jgi:hypothetical protein
MLKKLLGVEITECKLEECEFGHPKYRPDLPKELAAKTEVLREKTKHIKGSTWGWVYIDAGGTAWYYWYDCDTRTPTRLCRPWQPSDIDTCDIHYEPGIYIYDLGAWYGGLVNFGGCVPAVNCGGDCGQVNSKRKHVCLRRFSEAPEVFQRRNLWCLYKYGSTGLSRKDTVYDTGLSSMIHQKMY